jgi:hypothetical protein
VTRFAQARAELQLSWANKEVKPLYQHLFHLYHPSLCFIGTCPPVPCDSLARVHLYQPFLCFIGMCGSCRMSLYVRTPHAANAMPKEQLIVQLDALFQARYAIQAVTACGLRRSNDVMQAYRTAWFPSTCLSCSRRWWRLCGQARRSCPLKPVS